MGINTLMQETCKVLFPSGICRHRTQVLPMKLDGEEHGVGGALPLPMLHLVGGQGYSPKLTISHSNTP